MKTTRSLFVRGLGAAVTLAAVAFCSLNAQAEPVVAISNPFANVEDTNNTVSGSTWFATGFTTGTNPDFLGLTSVALSLNTQGTLPSSNPIVSLYTGSTEPTSLFSTLNLDGGPITSAIASTATFSPSASPLTLSPSTTYWVVMSAPTSDAFGWFSAFASPTAQNSSGYSYFAGKRSTSAGTTWSNSSAAAQGAMSVTVTAVPEPATIGLASIGILGAVMMQRRWRRKMVAASVDSDSDVG